jgi:hypothetical protein
MFCSDEAAMLGVPARPALLPLWQKFPSSTHRSGDPQADCFLDVAAARRLMDERTAWDPPMIIDRVEPRSVDAADTQIVGSTGSRARNLG